MSGGMPYQLEKGPTFSVTESVLDNIDLRITSLAWLRAHPHENFDAQPTLDSTSLDDPNPNVPTKQQRFDHQEHWYGEYILDATGKLVQKPYAPDNRTTGYWHNWYGDSQGIMREVWVRAIEVSLGVPHEPGPITPDQINAEKTKIRGQMKRQWPIDVFWRCPAPWFEGWVTWRGSPAEAPETVSRSGHVTVHIHTPSHKGSGLIQSPQRPEYLLRTPVPEDYAQEPMPGSPFLVSDCERGMWVVAQEKQELQNPASRVIDLEEWVPVAPGNTVNPAGDDDGEWFLDQIPIGASFVSVGDVVVVRPSEPDGGVRCVGRPYTP